MSDQITLKCIRGSLMGQSFTLDEGKSYLIGRGGDVNIRTDPVSEMSVSRQNTILRVEDGIPYVGSRKQSDTVGTWLNGKHLAELANVNDIRDGWYELLNDDIIGVGRGGNTLQFQIQCPCKGTEIGDPIWWEAIKKRIQRELENPTRRHRDDTLKQAKVISNRVLQKVADYMEDAEVTEDVYELPEKEAVDRLAVEIPAGHIKFEDLMENPDEKALGKIVSDYELAVEIPTGHIKFQEYELRTKKTKKPEKKSTAIPVWITADDRDAADSEAEAPVGKSYEEEFPWECIKQIGEGGFSRVYLVKDKRDGELMVLKSLDVVQELTRTQIAKYRREAELGKVLEHPNLVKTYQLREHNGKYYMFMEYCEQGSITDLLKENRGYLELDDAVELFLQVLTGLDYLHNVPISQPDEDGNMQEVVGVVHRDIKPDNMLLHKEGDKLVVKISDFGLSKAYELAGYSGMTGGEVAGSLKYVSKKQLSANYRFAGPSEDVFSAAASFYEMVSGRPCRDFDSFSAPYEAILKGNLVPLKKANSYLPDALCDVIDNVLKEEQLGTDEKYTTALELKTQIMNALNIG